MKSSYIKNNEIVFSTLGTIFLMLSNFSPIYIIGYHLNELDLSNFLMMYAVYTLLQMLILSPMNVYITRISNNILSERHRSQVMAFCLLMLMATTYYGEKYQLVYLLVFFVTQAMYLIRNAELNSKLLRKEIFYSNLINFLLKVLILPIYFNIGLVGHYMQLFAVLSLCNILSYTFQFFIHRDRVECTLPRFNDAFNFLYPLVISAPATWFISTGIRFLKLSTEELIHYTHLHISVYIPMLALFTIIQRYFNPLFYQGKIQVNYRIYIIFLMILSISLFISYFMIDLLSYIMHGLQLQIDRKLKFLFLLFISMLFISEFLSVHQIQRLDTIFLAKIKYINVCLALIILAFINLMQIQYNLTILTGVLGFTTLCQIMLHIWKVLK